MLYFIKIKPPATGIRGCVWKIVKLILRVTLCNLVLILRVTSNVRWSRQMPSCRQKTWKKFATAFVFTGQNCVHRVMLLWNFFFGGWNSYPERLGGSRSFSGWRVELCQERDTAVMTISMAWVWHSPLLSAEALYLPVARSAAGEKILADWKLGHQPLLASREWEILLLELFLKGRFIWGVLFLFLLFQYLVWRKLLSMLGPCFFWSDSWSLHLWHPCSKKRLNCLDFCWMCSLDSH